MLQHAPDDILTHAVAAIHRQLLVEIIGSAARRDLRNQFRSPLNETIRAGTGLTARNDPEQQVRLWFVVEIQANCGVIADLHSWSGSTIHGKPTVQCRVLT